MSFKFKETLTLTVPDVEEQLSAFSEGDYTQNHGLIIEIAAIHEGMTANYNFYSAEALKGALESWVQPYPKPVILNHDTSTEPLGRIMAARMETESDGTPYTKLQVAVKDPSAIAKVMDQRYLTGSVGGRAEEALCSVCEADWAKASIFEAPCKHSRGKTYKGKMAYLKLGELSFKEYSFVNVPADQRSTVRATSPTAQEAAAEDDWVRPLHVFSLDMNKEEIVEFSESADRNVLEGMRHKDSAPVYMQLKGAFLSTLATMEFDKESDVADELTTESDDDILAVTEGLTADLAAEHEEEPAPEETSAEETPETKDVPEGGEGNDEPEASEDNDGEETDKVTDSAPEGQEKPSDEDELPVTRDSDEEPTETPEDEPAAEEAATQTNDVHETDLNEAQAALESRVEELEAEKAALLEQVATQEGVIGKLKSALKHSLAERVVDMKITLGLAEQSGRMQLLEEHANRSASSLADSLRDLASMPIPAREAVEAPPALTELSGAVNDGGNVTTEGEDDAEVTELDPEDYLVDVLMGRKTL